MVVSLLSYFLPTRCRSYKKMSESTLLLESIVREYKHMKDRFLIKQWYSML